MEQYNLYLPFLDIVVKKDPETNNIEMDIFYNKKLKLRDVLHLTRATPKTMLKQYTFYTSWKNLHPSGIQQS